MITVTESAVAKIQDILAEENNPELKLRVFVQGGGCSGMSYGFTLDDVQNEDDWDLDYNGVQVLVDSMSGGYLQGAVIDYCYDTDYFLTLPQNYNQSLALRYESCAPFTYENFSSKTKLMNKSQIKEMLKKGKFI